MATVTIGAVSYDVYSDVSTADDFLAADIQYSSLWSAQTNDVKSQALVSATRWIDRQSWSGTKTSDAQALEWPRDGVSCSDVTDGVIPQSIINSSIILAAELVADSSAQSKGSGSSLVKEASAGSASVSFFRGNSSSSSAVFSPRVMDLIGGCLAGSGGSFYGIRSGLAVDESEWEGDPFGLTGDGIK